MTRAITIAKATVLAVLLGGFLLVGSAASAQVRDRDYRCNQRIRQAEVRLNQAIRRYGENSRQTRKRRYQLEQTRESCRIYRDRDRDRRY